MSDNYPSDVTDEQWQVLRKLLPKRARLGRPPIDRRRVVNAVLYLNRSGCQWRMLPLEYPKWKTVYTIFRRWRLDGTWQSLNEALAASRPLRLGLHRRRLRRVLRRLAAQLGHLDFEFEFGDSGPTIDGSRPAHRAATSPASRP